MRLKGAVYPTKPLATTTATSWTDTTVPKDGNVYYYEVRAYDKASNTSSGTADLGITTVDRIAPAAPKGVEDNWAMGSPTKITLYWDSNTEPDLAEYRVYRSTSRPVALTPANRLASTGGGYSGPLPQTGDVYYYVVTAVDTHGNESPASGTAMYYSDDLTGPVETPLGTRVTEGETGVTVTWDASGGTSSDFAGWSVFRALKPRASGITVWEVAQGLKGTTTFVDNTVKPGTTYYYWVVAKDWEGNPGHSSADLPVTVAGNTTSPAAIEGVTTVPKENGVTVSWKASGDPSLDHYRVLRGAFADGQWNWTPVGDRTNERPWLTGTTWHDVTPADGEQVRYAVVGVDQYGNQLTPDTGATVTGVTELDLRPTAPPATGSPFTWIHPNGPRDFNLYLEDTTNENGSEATGFNVRRWNPATGTFDLLGTGEISYPMSWHDADQPKATTLFYRFTVVYADGTESGATELAGDRLSLGAAQDRGIAGGHRLQQPNGVLLEQARGERGCHVQANRLRGRGQWIGVRRHVAAGRFGKGPDAVVVRCGEPDQAPFVRRGALDRDERDVGASVVHTRVGRDGEDPVASADQRPHLLDAAEFRAPPGAPALRRSAGGERGIRLPRSEQPLRALGSGPSGRLPGDGPPGRPPGSGRPLRLSRGCPRPQHLVPGELRHFHRVPPRQRMPSRDGEHRRLPEQHRARAVAGCERRYRYREIVDEQDIDHIVVQWRRPVGEAALVQPYLASRMPGPQQLRRAHHELCGGRPQEPDAQHAVNTPARGHRSREGVQDLLVRGLQVVEEASPGRGEGHPSAGPLEEGRADRPFQLLDRLADHGHRDVQSLGAAPEVQLLADRKEDLDLTPLHDSPYRQPTGQRSLQEWQLMATPGWSRLEHTAGTRSPKRHPRKPRRSP